MAEFSETDHRQARGLVEELLENREGFRGDLPQGFSLADVQNDADQFSAELEIASAFGDGIPVTHTDHGPIPIALTIYGFGPYQGLRGVAFLRAVRRNPYVYELWRELMWSLRHELSESSGGVSKTELVSPDQAREHFLARAADFLATRLAWTRDWVKRAGKGGPPDSGPPWSLLRLPPSRGRPPSSVPGCNFSVFTETENLCVHWSGAYYLSPNYFGHPTSPAKGPLQAGTYVFGVTGGAYGHMVQWDLNSVCTLPGVPSVHLDF